ncbi:MAG: hypothetical protein ABSF28_00590 [Terracidiphilus sp.]
MSKSIRWVHILLEVIGGLALVAGLGWLAFCFLFIVPMSHFSDGNCSPDTEQRLVNAPDGGAHNFKSLHRTCGQYNFFFAYLSTGNPNKGYEYEPILELKNVGPGAATAAWEGPNRIVVTFPKSAEVVDAYAKSFGIDVILRPE